MLSKDAVDIVRLMNLLWAFDDRDPVSAESLQGGRECWQDARCSESIPWYLLYEEGLDLIDRRTDKGLIKCRTRQLLWIDRIANLR